MALIGVSVVAAVAATVALAWLVKYLRLVWVINRMHGYPSLLFIGNVHQFKVEPDEFFEQVVECCELYPRPRMSRIWMTTQPYVLIYGAEEAEALLSSARHIDKSREYAFLHPWLGLGLLTSAAEKWRPRRKLLTPSFHHDILRDFVDVFNQQSRLLVELMAEQGGDGRPFDAFPLVTLCALDIICQSAMGRTVNAQRHRHSPYVAALYEINHIIHERQKQPLYWPQPIFWYFGRGKRQQSCLDILHGFTQKVIDERHVDFKKGGGAAGLMNRMNNNNNNNMSKSPSASAEQSVKGRHRLVFLDLLLDLVERGKIPLADVREEVDTFMFEGHDTTSAGINWAIQLLGNHPDVQRKAQQEVDAVFGEWEERDLSFEEIGSLKYVECCVKEALRLYPSVPIFARSLNEQLVIGDYRLPAGVQALVIPYMVHRDPRHWPEPERYEPERFLPERAAGRHPYAFLPFSAGSRNCIGQRFALLEMKAVLARVLRHFELRAVRPRERLRPKAELILRPSEGVHVTLRLRHPLPQHLPLP